MDFAVETRGLTRDFGSFRAVDGIDLAVPAGSFYGFLGPNGAGKSTTIKCLTGLLRPSAGTMRILGIDPLADPVAVKRKIGVVPEDLALFDRLTAEETLTFVAQVHGLDRDTARSRASDLLDVMDLKSAGGTLVTDFSHGMRKKLSLAAALLPGAAPALSRRAVRRHRRGRVATDQGPAAVVRRPRRHDLPDVAHPRNRRTALDAHRRDREGPARRAGDDRRAPRRGAAARHLEELFIELVGGDDRTPAALDWI